MLYKSPNLKTCHTRFVNTDLSECLVKGSRCSHQIYFSPHHYCNNPDRRLFERQPKSLTSSKTLMPAASRLLDGTISPAF